MPQTRRAIVAFGANEGDPLANITHAIKRLSESFKIGKASSLYRNKAVGGPSGQADFLNGVATFYVDVSAKDLMNKLLKIETDLGRVRIEKWGPRTIDLDILDYDGVAINDPDLILPHPRMMERAFVLYPLREILPDWKHPVTGISVTDAIAALSDADRAGILGKEPMP